MQRSAWDNFFRLAPAESRGVYVVELPDDVLAVDDQARLARGEVGVDGPLPFRLVKGRRPADVLGATSGYVTLISDRVRGALEEGGFSGWEALPAPIHTGDGQPIEGFHVLAVTGRSGPLRDELSERVTLPAPVPGGVGGPGLRGMLFEPDTWDGSDVFAPEGTTLVFITRRAKEAVEALKPANALLQPIGEIEQIAF